MDEVVRSKDYKDLTVEFYHHHIALDKAILHVVRLAIVCLTANFHCKYLVHM